MSYQNAYIAGYTEITSRAFDGELYLSAEGFDTSKSMFEDLVTLHDLSGQNGRESLPKDELSDALYCSIRKPSKESRESIVSILDSRVDAALNGTNSPLITLRGNAGIGKTTFLRHYFVRHRARRTDIKKFIVLWINLKMLKDFSRGFRHMHSTLKRIHGEYYHHDVAIWHSLLKDRLPDYPQTKWSEMAIKEVIRSCITNDESIVTQFLYFWKNLNGGNVFLVVDNIDTITSPIPETIQEVIAQTRADAQYLASGDRSPFDVVFLPVRPESLEDFAAPKRVAIHVNSVDLPELDLRHAISLRAKYVQNQFDTTQHRFMQVHRQVGPVSIESEPTPRKTKPNDNRISGSGYWTPPKDLQFFILDIIGQDSCKKGILNVAAIAESLFAEPPDLSAIRGARDSEAREIFHRFCGNSMRRAVGVCKAIFESPGLFIRLLPDGDPQIRPYVFLDAMVSWSLRSSSLTFVSDSDEVFGRIRLANVLSSGGEGGQFYGPELLLLPAYIALILVDRHSSKSPTAIPDEELTDEVVQFGFKNAEVALSIQRLENWGFLTSFHCREQTFYLIDKDVLEAHRLLFDEAAYWDNLAQLIPSNWGYTEISATVGYDNTDRLARARNTSEFLKWVIRQETTLFNDPKDSRFRTRRDGWQSRKLRSLGSLAVTAFVTRVDGLIDFLSADESRDHSELRELQSIKSGLADYIQKTRGCSLSALMTTTASEHLF